MDCIFCKIINKKIPAKIVHEDEKVLAFDDITPQAPIHVLIIPKRHIASLAELNDPAVMSDIFKMIRKIAVEKGIDKSGFRTVINNGRAAGQAVDHLHIHLLGGRDFSWPPG